MLEEDTDAPIIDNVKIPVLLYADDLFQNNKRITKRT